MASDKDSYLTVYRRFFENFAATVNPHDQLPVKLASYKFNNDEIAGGVVDWTLQYLNQKQCPSNLIAPLVKTVIDEIKQTCKKQPTACGFNSDEKAYEPLKLMQAVMSKVNEVCLRYLDNSELDCLPAPPPLQSPFRTPIVSTYAIKNTRKRMEDRHVYIDDLNTMFNIQDSGPASYYGIFDGHAGQAAASYSVAHLHQYLAESFYYPTNPERAFREAFVRTDAAFIDKAQKEKLCGGTTAVCALLRPKHFKLYVAWVGDALALLVNRGRVLQIVKPHKPSREEERERIEDMGGHVGMWSGVWRVNGQLAVSRAIGDADYKPYVTGDPDVACVPLDGGEDFLILASDGLWDCVTEDEAACLVYRSIYDNPADTDRISKQLVQLAKDQGSGDNISIIVVFLRHPQQIASSPHPSNVAPWGYNVLPAPDSPNRNGDSATAHPLHHRHTTDNNMDVDTLDATLDNSNTAANNPFMNSNQKSVTGAAADIGQLLDQFGGDDLHHHHHHHHQHHQQLVAGGATTDELLMPVFNKQNGGTAASTPDEDEDEDEEDEEEEEDEDNNADLRVETTETSNDHYNYERAATNGKRSHEDEYDDEEEEDEEEEEERSEDFGPETDVDAVDDVLLSPSIVAAKALSEGVVNNNPFDTGVVGEKEQRDDVDSDESHEFCDDLIRRMVAAHDNSYEGDVELQRQQTHEFDVPAVVRDPREETPTPPVDAVLENSGCVATDNVAESVGEETDDEDEWNYIRGDKSDYIERPQTPVEHQDNIENQHDKEQLTQEEIDMASQLNPDAAEFVPVSPVRSGGGAPPLSPPLRGAHLLRDDELLAGSPRQPVPMAQAVPSPVEFLCEVSKRPGNLLFDNEDDVANGHHTTTSELMENLLNGKNVEEIEFHPKISSEFAGKHGDEFEAQPDESECFSTKADFGDESTTSFMGSSDFQKSVTGVSTMETSFADSTNSSQIIGSDLQDFQKTDFITEFKPQDPMSMSFYQDKDADDDSEFNRNPFDLNSVQRIPDNVDEFIGTADKEVSDLDVDVLNAVGEIQSAVPDAEKGLAFVEEKEQESPMDEHMHELSADVGAQNGGYSQLLSEDSKSPEPNNDAVLQEVQHLAQSPSPIPAIADECLMAETPDESVPIPTDSLKDDEEHLIPSEEHSDSAITPDPYSHSPLLAEPLIPTLEITTEVDIHNVDDEDVPLEAHVDHALNDLDEALDDGKQDASGGIQQATSPIFDAQDDFQTELSAALESSVTDFKAPPTPEPVPIDVPSPAQIPTPEPPQHESESEPEPEPELIASPIPILHTPEPPVEQIASPEPTTEDREEVAQSPAFDVIPQVETVPTPEPAPVVEQIAASPTQDNDIPFETAVTPDAFDEKPFSPEPTIDEGVAVSSPIPHVESPVPCSEPVASPIQDVVTSPTPIEVEEPAFVADISADISSAAPDIDSFLARSPSPNPPHSPLEQNLELNLEVQEKQELTFSLVEPVDERLGTGDFTLETKVEVPSTETPPPTPASAPLESQLESETTMLEEAVERLAEIPPAQESESILPAVAAAVAGVAAVGAATAIIKETAEKPSPAKAKSATTTTTRKSLTSAKTPTSPIKAPSSAPARRPPTTTTSSRVSTSKSAPIKSTLTKPASAASPSAKPAAAPLAKSSPRPKTAGATTSSTMRTATERKTLLEKKPLANGDVAKAPLKSATAIRRPTSGSTATAPASKVGAGTSPSSRTATASKLSPTLASRPLTAATRPTTAPTKTGAAPLAAAAAARTAASATAAASKPRPTTLTAKPTNGLVSRTSTPRTTLTSSAASKPASSAAPRPSVSSTASARPKTSSVSSAAAPRARPASTRPSSAAPRAPLGIDKQLKETANKQLSARTTTSTLTKTSSSSSAGARTTTSTLTRKTETKSPLTKTTKTTPTTASGKPLAGTKKPTAVTRTTTITKTSTIGAAPAGAGIPAAHQNGTVTLVQEITNVSIVAAAAADEPQLLKDASPIIEPIAPQHIDNAHVVDNINNIILE